MPKTPSQSMQAITVNMKHENIAAISLSLYHHHPNHHHHQRQVVN